MTTDTDKASPAQDEEDGSILPTVLAGAGILAVAALLIFWPSDDDASKSANAGGGKTGVSEANGGKAGGPRGRAAGVGARPSDAATPRPSSSTRNPAIKFPEGAHGMAPMPEEQAKDPPAGASTSDKIAFYEKRLDAAIIARDSRKKFADRLPKVKERVEASDNPTDGLKAFERRKKIVEDNYAKAQQDVEYIESKLAELRGA